MLNNANVNIRLPEMPRPENFEMLKNAKVIYTGLLNDYKYEKLELLNAS